LKGALDDEISAWLEKNEYVENTSTIDFKIVLYAVAIGLAYWSHFVI